jgi:hypothetical protein
MIVVKNKIFIFVFNFDLDFSLSFYIHQNIIITNHL